MKALLAILAVALVSGICFAVDAGTFTCPSGQVEDLNCASACCSQAGGTYDFGQETCTVDTSAQWNAAAQCEQQRNCCTSAGNNGSTSSSGCCGSALVLFAGLGLLGFAAWKR